MFNLVDCRLFDSSPRCVVVASINQLLSLLFCGGFAPSNGHAIRRRESLTVVGCRCSAALQSFQWRCCCVVVFAVTLVEHKSRHGGRSSDRRSWRMRANILAVWVPAARTQEPALRVVGECGMVLTVAATSSSRRCERRGGRH
jgi:hypothetical protein